MGQNAMKNQARACHRTRNRPQAGSALFLVFIMIALFAALTMAISRGSRTGTTAFSDDKAKLAATEIVDYLNKYKSAFDRLIINGCDQLKIDFSTPYYMRVDGTPIDIAPPSTTAECGMYTQNGGGLKPTTFEQYGSPTYAPNSSNPKAGHGGARYMDASVGSAENDLLFNIAALDEKICLASINLMRDNRDPFSALPSDTYSTAGAVSYAKGSPGTLNPIALPVNSKIFSVYNTATSTCSIFLILKAN